MTQNDFEDIKQIHFIFVLTVFGCMHQPYTHLKNDGLARY